MMSHADESSRQVRTGPPTPATPQPDSGYAASFINLLKSIVGAGLFAMPLAFASVGIVPGVLITLAAAFFSAFGLYVLVLCARAVGRDSSFFELSMKTYPRLAYFVDAAIILKCYGVAASYLIMVGQLLPDVFQVITNGDSLLLSKYFWISTAMIVCVPLSFLKRIDSLKYTSFAALLAVVYIVITMLVKCYPMEQGGDGWFWVVPSASNNILKRLALFFFAFTCHQNVSMPYVH